MPKQKAQATYNNFIKGLITESTEVNFPANASLDEDNCVLFRKGNRRRRLGIDYVSTSTLSSDTFNFPTKDTTEFKSYRWKAVGGNGDVVFSVFQIGTQLYFYDSVTLGLINSIDLTLYKIAGSTDANIEGAKVDMVASRGKLFVTGKYFNPFYVSYTAPTTLAVTAITINTRDFTGLDDGLTVDNNPLLLTKEHNYNLLNQGWIPTANGIDLIAAYFTDQAVYPANNQIWFLGKDGTDVFTPALLIKQTFGNTPAPKGHYVIDPFNIDRSGVSGVAGIAVSGTTNRPECVESFAGRIWYAGVEADSYNGTVYFSQILNHDLTNAGKCYQVGDPTSEQDSALVDNDGGELPIADIGTIRALRVVGDTLCVFADNGVWGITGGAGGFFKATDYSVYQITNIGVISKDSVANVEGKGVYWSDLGIYQLVRDNISGRFTTQSISLMTIQSFFNDISLDCIKNVQTIYDENRQQVLFLYSGTASDTTYKRTKILILDTAMGAFTKFTISDASANSPHIIGAIYNTNSTDWWDSSVSYVAAVKSASVYKYTFANFNNVHFLDWFSFDSAGTNYSSYIEAGFEFVGDLMKYKQATFVIPYFEQTESAFIANSSGGYDYDKPSSCIMRMKWDFADSQASNRWSEAREVYRLQRLILPDPANLTFSYGQSVISTKNKVRGKGRAIVTRFESSTGKDFNLLGWAVFYSADTDI